MTDMIGPWPEPHPKLGEALNLHQVGKLLGVGANAVDVHLARTRAGRARTPFPEPDGVAYPPIEAGGYSKPPCRYWWQGNIERFRDAKQRAGGARRVISDADIARIRRMRIDGKGVHTISHLTGWSIATVSRILTGKAHAPKGPQQ